MQYLRIGALQHSSLMGASGFKVEGSQGLRELHDSQRVCHTALGSAYDHGGFRLL